MRLGERIATSAISPCAPRVMPGSGDRRTISVRRLESACLLRLTRCLLVKLKKINDRSRIATTHAAFSADPEVINCRFCSLDTLARPLNSIAQMQQAQVELRAWLKLQMAQRRKIGSVSAVARDRQVYPFDRSFNARVYAVGDLHKISRIFGLDEMFVATVSVAQVIAKMDVRRAASPSWLS